MGSVRSFWGRAEPTAAAPGGRKEGLHPNPEIRSHRDEKDRVRER